MRIVHVINTLDPAHGGPPMVAIRLAAAQAARGHAVSILSGDDPAIARQYAAIAAGGVPDADRVSITNISVQSDFQHIHGVWGSLLKRTAGVGHTPYAVMSHGMLDRWSMSQKRLKKRIGLALGYRRMLNRAAFLHVLNADESAGLAPLRLTSPVCTVPNGIFPEEVDPLPPPGQFRAAYPALGADRFCLFLGRLHHKKGLDLLAAAFAAVPPPCRLVVAGPDGGARPAFESQIAAAGLSDRVHVVGPIYGRDKFAALVDAALFVLPSRQEGFSLAILEAMAAGCPVVVSDACHFPEVATAGAGEVVPLDAGQIAAAVNRVLAAPGDRGQRGRDLVMSRYTWPAVAEQLDAAYARHLPRR